MFNRFFSVTKPYSRLKVFEETKKIRPISSRIEELRNKLNSLGEELKEEEKNNPTFKKNESDTYNKHTILSNIIADIDKVIIPFNNFAPLPERDETKAVLFLIQSLQKIIETNLDAAKIKVLLKHRNDKRYYANLALAIGCFFAAGSLLLTFPQSLICTYLQTLGYVNAYKIYQHGFNNYVSESFKIIMELYDTLIFLEQEIKLVALPQNDQKTLYELLNVLPNATTQEIKKSYFKLAKIHHPDKNPNDTRSAEYFIKITHAKDILIDPVKRDWYDKSIHINLRQYGYR